MKKRSKVILIVSFILILGIIISITIIMKNSNNKKSIKKENNKENEVEKFELIYEINKDCLNYLNSLDKVDYKTFSESEFKDTIIEYDDNKYLVCLNSISYKSKNKSLTLKEAFENKILSSIQLENELNKINKVIIINELEKDKLPNLILKNITIKENDSYKIEDFIENCTTSDNEECILKYSDESMGKYNKVGNYKIEIIASDKNGSEITNKAELVIEESDSKQDPIKEDTNNNNTNKNTNVNNNTNTNSNNSISNNQNDKQTNETVENNNQSSKPVIEQKKETCEDRLKNNPNPTSSNQFIKYESEEKNLETTYKYGVKIDKTLYTTYAIYADIGKCKFAEDTYENMDRSTFSATTNDLKPEAISILNSNLNIVKEVGIKTLNSYRKEVNKQDLVYDYELSLAATIRAMEMYWSNKKSHTRPNGNDWYTIYFDMGIQYMAAGENIAWGYLDLKNAMVGWKNSPGHYANMISDNFKKVGIGYYNENYVTLFD